MSTKYDAKNAGSVTFVNTFNVHSSTDEFEQVFAEISEFMAAQPGFIQYTLSRHIDDDKKYVNIALWTDVESWRAAVAHPGFAQHAKEIRSRCTNEHSMYEPRQAFAAS